MTSYRSTPEITALFASLLPPEEQLQVSSIQRADEPPAVRAFDDDAAYAEALRAAVAGARAGEGLAAVIVPWKHEAKRLQATSILRAGSTPYPSSFSSRSTPTTRSNTLRPRCRSQPCSLKYGSDVTRCTPHSAYTWAGEPSGSERNTPQREQPRERREERQR